MNNKPAEMQSLKVSIMSKGIYKHFQDMVISCMNVCVYIMYIYIYISTHTYTCKSMIKCIWEASNFTLKYIINIPLISKKKMCFTCLIQDVPNLFEHRTCLFSFNIQPYPAEYTLALKESKLRMVPYNFSAHSNH